jgi:hypothetical protein
MVLLALSTWFRLVRKVWQCNSRETRFTRVPGARPVSRERFNLLGDYPSQSLCRRHLPLYKARLGRHLNTQTFPHVESDRFVRRIQ